MVWRQRPDRRLPVVTDPRADLRAQQTTPRQTLGSLGQLRQPSRPPSPAREPSGGQAYPSWQASCAHESLEVGWLPTPAGPSRRTARNSERCARERGPL